MIDVDKISFDFLKTKRLLNKIDGALVGGSYARGEATKDSDIDILVLYKKEFVNELTAVHSKEITFKKYQISLIFQSKNNLVSNLKNPDPSVISFFRNCIIIYDPKNYLQKLEKRVQKIKIIKDKYSKKESKRRLHERIDYNVKKIESAIQNHDLILATFLLREIINEVVEKIRMYDEDWLYSQRKSNFKYLSTAQKNTQISYLFHAVNTPLDKKALKKLVSLLKKLNI